MDDHGRGSSHGLALLERSLLNYTRFTPDNVKIHVRVMRLVDQSLKVDQRTVFFSRMDPRLNTDLSAGNR